MSEVGERKSGRGWKIVRWAWRGFNAFAIILSLVLLVVLVRVTWINQRGERLKTEMHAELVDRGIVEPDPLAWREPEEMDGLAADAARWWRAATEAAGAGAPRSEALPLLGSGAEPEFGHPYHPESIAAMRQAERDNALLWQLVDHAKSLPRPEFRLRTTEEADADTHLLVGMIQIVRWYQMRALLAASEGDAAAAMDHVAFVLEVPEIIGDLDSRFAFIVRMSVDSRATYTLEQVLARCEPQTADLDIVDSRIAARLDEAGFEAAMLSDLAYFHRLMVQPSVERLRWRIGQDLDHRKSWPFLENAEVFDPLTPDEQVALWLARLETVLLPGRVEAKLAGIVRDRLEEYDRWQATHDDPAELWAYANHPPQNPTDSRSFRSTVKSHLTLLSTLRVARFALALERYRLQHGRWPESLQVVAPLAGLEPVDARGLPIRLLTTETGVSLYHFGRNGVDDLGRTNDQWRNDDIENEDEPWDDHVFRLIDPDRRNVGDPPAQAVDRDPWFDDDEPAGEQEALP